MKQLELILTVVGLIQACDLISGQENTINGITDTLTINDTIIVSDTVIINDTVTIGDTPIVIDTTIVNDTIVVDTIQGLSKILVEIRAGYIPQGEWIAVDSIGVFSVNRDFDEYFQRWDRLDGVGDISIYHNIQENNDLIHHLAWAVVEWQQRHNQVGKYKVYLGGVEYGDTITTTNFSHTWIDDFTDQFSSVRIERVDGAPINIRKSEGFKSEVVYY